MASIIPTRIIPSVTPADMSPRAVGRELLDLIERGAALRIAGEARGEPRASPEAEEPPHDEELEPHQLELPVGVPVYKVGAYPICLGLPAMGPMRLLSSQSCPLGCAGAAWAMAVADMAVNCCAAMGC